MTPGFCPYVLELYDLGITVGTSATTFSPDDPLTRGQGAVFIAKGLNQSLARSSRRAALGQWWTNKAPGLLPMSLPFQPDRLASDGADVWLASSRGISRIRASDGRLLDTWMGPGVGVLVAMGRIFTHDSAQSLYMIDATQPPTFPAVVAINLPSPDDLAFDGSRIWITNNHSVSIVTPGPSIPWAVNTVNPGFSTLHGLVFDGTNIWVADQDLNVLFKLDANGAIQATAPAGIGPGNPLFDGANIWVPNQLADTVTVVQAATATPIATLTGNGISRPFAAAFDGERVVVTNLDGGVSIWRADDLSPLGFVPLAGGPTFVCSDGINFWISLNDINQVVRF